GRASSCARLKKQIHDSSTSKCRHFLDLATSDFFEGVGGLQYQLDLIDRQRGKTQQILTFEAHSVLRSYAFRITTRSSSPSSSIMTCTFSSREVGRFFPM